MNEQDLRKALSKRLRCPLSSPLWQCLEEGGYINDFWDELDQGVTEREALEGLCEISLRFLRFHQAMLTSEKDLNHADKQGILHHEPFGDLLEADIDQYVSERNEAIAVYRRRLAEDSEAVLNFFTTVLGG